MDDTLRTQGRAARKNFAAMASAYSLGVFNDNFYRRTVVVLAITGSVIAEGWVLAIFTLPYVLLAWLAGWLADRYPKHHVVVLAKALEIVAMSLGAAGLLLGNWPLLLAMVFLMALQSCLFGPALNGSIPELYPAEYVHRANSLLNAAVRPMILAGYVLGGIALAAKGDNIAGIELARWVAAVAIVGVSVVGFIVSLGAPSRPAAAPHSRFPRTGPWHTIRELVSLRKDRLLAVAIAGDVFIWCVGSMLLLLIDALALRQYGWSKTTASVLMAAQLVGLALGGVLSNIVAHGDRWRKALPPAAALLGLTLIGLGFLPMLPAVQVSLPLAWMGVSRLPLPFVVCFVLLGLSGVFGGIFMVPVEAFIQVRAPAEKKGTVLASVAFSVFLAMTFTGALDVGLLKLLTLASHVMAVVGGIALVVAIGLWRALKTAGD